MLAVLSFRYRYLLSLQRSCSAPEKATEGCKNSCKNYSVKTGVLKIFPCFTGKHIY